MLSDAGSATIKQYGLLNTTVAATDPRFGYPFPGTFIVDRRGVVTTRIFEETYQERDTISSVFTKLGQGGRPGATRTSAPHVEIVSFATDKVAAPGTRFAVVLDVTPAAKVHVYAPGVAGYIPIALAVKPQPGLLVKAAQYPKPEDYFFKPLNEHVNVYARPFRIVQDLAIDPSRDAAAALKEMKAMTISATLDYQACDDKICFTPQSIPLSWTI